MDNTKYFTGIYAIKDTIAEQIVGGLYLHKHEAAAVRFFADVASVTDSIIGKHPQDFDLIRLGYLSLDNDIKPDNAVILRGSIWAASQERAQQPQLHIEA